MKLAEEVFKPMSFKMAKAFVAVFSATIAFGVLHARAQPGGSAAQPSAAPSYVGGLPVAPPPGWTAERWAAMRQSCQVIADKMAAKQSLTTGEASERKLCIRYSGSGLGIPAAPPQVPEVPGPNVAPLANPSA